MPAAMTHSFSYALRAQMRASSGAHPAAHRNRNRSSRELPDSRQDLRGFAAIQQGLCWTPGATKNAPAWSAPVDAYPSPRSTRRRRCHRFHELARRRRDA